MTWLRLVAVLVFVAGAGVLVWLQQRTPPWIEVKDPDGLFAISFPDKPLTNEQDVKDRSGASVGKVRAFSYGTSWEDEFYSVATSRLDQTIPKEKIDPALDAAVANFAKSIADAPGDFHPTIKSTIPWTVGGHPGREAVIDVKYGHGIVVCRVAVLDDHTLLMLETGVHVDHHGENDKRFLDSLRLLR